MLQKKRTFFKHALKTMRTSGTIMPSSRILVKKILGYIDFSKANVIVELGPGNGVFTEQILKKLNKNATLICFEIDPTFYAHLKAIKHSQLIVLNTSAEFISLELKKLGFHKTSHIISSLPLTFIPKEVSKNILTNSYQTLEDNGLFVQFQYSWSYYKRLKEVFKDAISLHFEFRNVPPAFIYKCIKKQQ